MIITIDNSYNQQKLAIIPSTCSSIINHRIQYNHRIIQYNHRIIIPKKKSSTLLIEVSTAQAALFLDDTAGRPRPRTSVRGGSLDLAEMRTTTIIMIVMELGIEIMIIVIDGISIVNIYRTIVIAMVIEIVRVIVFKSNSSIVK